MHAVLRSLAICLLHECYIGLEIFWALRESVKDKEEVYSKL